MYRFIIVYKSTVRRGRDDVYQNTVDSLGGVLSYATPYQLGVVNKHKDMADYTPSLAPSFPALMAASISSSLADISSTMAVSHSIQQSMTGYTLLTLCKQFGRYLGEFWSQIVDELVDSLYQVVLSLAFARIL